MHSSQRHAILQEHVAKHGFISIEKLTSLCGVSAQTARRDIMELSRQGLVVRLHGGAGALSMQEGSPFEVRRKTNVEAKQKVGKMLAGIIPDRSTLFIGGGTTLEISGEQLLHKEGLFVMTTNLHVALSMQRCKQSTILVPHGEVQLGSRSLVGSTIEACLSQYAMDICLISTASIHEDGDFYEFNHDIANNLKVMKRFAKRVILAADSSKFNQGGVVRVGNISEVSTFVTNVRPSEAMCALFDKHGVELICP